MNGVWTQDPDTRWPVPGTGPEQVSQLLEQLRRDVGTAQDRIDPHRKTLEVELRLIGRGGQALARIDAGTVPGIRWNDLVSAAETTVDDPARGYQLIVPAEVLAGLTDVPEQLRSSAGAPVELLLAALMPEADTILAVPNAAVAKAVSGTSLTTPSDPNSMRAVTTARVAPSALDDGQRRCYLQLRADGLDVDEAYQATLALSR